MSSMTQSTAATLELALESAINLAKESYAGSDVQINWSVVNISGQSGGAHYDLEDSVTIRITHSLSREYLEAQAFELEEELAA